MHYTNQMYNYYTPRNTCTILLHYPLFNMMSPVESNEAFISRMKDTSPSDDDVYDVIVASLMRTFTKRKTPFAPPALVVTEEELGARVEECMRRVSRTMDSYLHATRSVCGVEVSSQVLQRVIFHLVERRGHLLLDCLPRGVCFLAEATRDLEAFLEQNPLYAPPHEAVGEFVENVWRSVSGKRSRSCTLWRKRKSGQRKENAAEESLSSMVISSPSSRTQPSSLPQPSLGEVSLKPRSSRVMRFPSL